MEEVFFDDWNDLRIYISEEFSKPLGYIFRGQADSEWMLESTLTRLIKNLPTESNHYKIEESILKHFKKKNHRFTRDQSTSY